MKKIKEVIILILTLIIIILLVKKCNNINNNIIEVRTDTIIKTISKIDTIKQIKPIKVIDTIFADSVIIKLIDSANCINLATKYYSKNIYSRELIKDSNMTLNLIDTIFENKIRTGIIKYDLKQKTIIINNTINKKYGIGGGVVLIDNILIPVGSFEYNNFSFEIGYNKSYLVGLKYKYKF